MTSEQRDLCLGLVRANGKQRISNAEFAVKYPAALENGRLATALLQDAYEARDGAALQCAMIVGFSFGFDVRHVDVLVRLIEERWHFMHEDVVSALDKLRTPRAADALFRATQWVPEHLEYDDARALAVKAIWGLGNLPGAASEAYLRQLATSPVEVIRTNAEEQLQRRAAGS
jgi:hypothetical protein